MPLTRPPFCALPSPLGFPGQRSSRGNRGIPCIKKCEQNVSAPPGVTLSLVTRGWASAVSFHAPGTRVEGRTGSCRLTTITLPVFSSQAAPCLLGQRSCPQAKPGQGDHVCPLGKTEHLADKVSIVLKATQQTGGAGTSSRATTRQGKDLAPCPPPCWHLPCGVGNECLGHFSGFLRKGSLDGWGCSWERGSFYN